MILIQLVISVIVSLRIHWPTAQNQAVHWLRLVCNQVRFWDLNNELKLKSGSLPDRKKSEYESWQDVIVGLKGKIRLNQKWYLSAWGVTTVAGDSDSAWDVFGAVGYHYSDSVSLSAGYRHQEVNYEKGEFLFDVEMSGLIIGATFHF